MKPPVWVDESCANKISCNNPQFSSLGLCNRQRERERERTLSRKLMEMALTQLAAVVAQIVSLSPEVAESSGSRGRTAFQWGGTISAIFLLIMNRIGRRSSMQYSLLAVYLFTSFPTVLFKILRGQFGCWVAFLAVAANLSFPEIFPVSRFLLFVITPDWVADGLRDSIVGGVFCLLVAILFVVMEIRGIGGFANWECNSHCCGYCLGLVLLFFFTTLYLCLGPW